MVQGFPKRLPPNPPGPAPRSEFKPPLPPTVPLDEIEYDEDGRRVIKAPVAPATTRPPPTTTPPPSLRMPPPPPPPQRPRVNTNVRPTRPAGAKPPLDFSKQAAPPPKPLAPKVAEPWKPRPLRPGETIALNPDDIPY
jgi:hypothetical protein